MRNASFLVPSLAAALAVAGCGGGGSASVATTDFVVFLTPGQSVHDVTSTASGRATISVAQDESFVRVQLTTQNLANATMGHIHVGDLGETGGVLFPLFDGGNFNGSLDVTLTSADFTASGDVNTFAQAIQAILEGGAYINLHTQAFPAGELRAQLAETLAVAGTASGDQEVPPVTSSASGTVRITINPQRTQGTYVVDLSSVPNFTMAHIHVGEAGTNGPVALLISDFGGPGTADYRFEATFDASDLLNTGTTGIGTMEDFVAALLDGRLYLNVHTTGNPAGEIRAQLAQP